MKNLFLLAMATLSLSACVANQENSATPPIEVEDKSKELSKELKLTPQNFSNLPNWSQENFVDFAQAYNRSCGRILKKNPQSNFGRSDSFGTYQQWQVACQKFKNINQASPQNIREFFEQNFTPYSVFAGNEVEGLFTGYFEASLKGSRHRHGVYQTPLRARPDDLVMLQLGEFRETLKGQRLAGRVIDGRLKPYETHEKIINLSLIHI